MAERITPLEQFGKLKLAHKAALTLLISAAVIGGFYLLFYQDLEDSITKAGNQKNVLRKELSEYQTQLKDKHEYQEKIQVLKRKRQIALEKLPEDEEIPTLLQKIDGLGKIVGLLMTEFTRQQPYEQQFYAVIPVSLKMEGTYHQIATFFDYVGNMTRIVNLQNIALRSTDQKFEATTDKMRIQAEVLATTYRYKPPKQAPPPKRKAAKGKKKKGGH